MLTKGRETLFITRTLRADMTWHYYDLIAGLNSETGLVTRPGHGGRWQRTPRRFEMVGVRLVCAHARISYPSPSRPTTSPSHL